MSKGECWNSILMIISIKLHIITNVSIKDSGRLGHIKIGHNALWTQIIRTQSKRTQMNKAHNK